MCVRVSSACGGQKRLLDPLELGVQDVVSLVTGVLGTQLTSSADC